MFNLKNTDEIIATREFTYKVDEKEQSLIVTMNKPKPDTRKGGDWECTFYIGEESTTIFGVDSFQALTLAQQMLSIKLNLLKKNTYANLNWLGMDDLGFRLKIINDKFK